MQDGFCYFYRTTADLIRRVAQQAGSFGSQALVPTRTDVDSRICLIWLLRMNDAGSFVGGPPQPPTLGPLRRTK